MSDTISTDGAFLPTIDLYPCDPAKRKRLMPTINGKPITFRTITVSASAIRSPVDSLEGLAGKGESLGEMLARTPDKPLVLTLDDAAPEPTNWHLKVFPARTLETAGRAILADAAIPCLGPVHAQLHGEFARGFDGDPPWLPHEAERRIRYLVDTLLQVVPWLQTGKTEGDR